MSDIPSSKLPGRIHTKARGHQGRLVQQRDHAFGCMALCGLHCVERGDDWVVWVDFQRAPAPHILHGSGVPGCLGGGYVSSAVCEVHIGCCVIDDDDDDDDDDS